MGERLQEIEGTRWRGLAGGEPTHEEVGVLAEVLRGVRRIRHGHVQIIIQDSRVVQIDHTEKVRLDRVGRGEVSR